MRERDINFLKIDMKQRENFISGYRTKINESTASISKLQKEIKDIQKNIDSIENEIREIEEEENKKHPKVSYTDYELLKRKYIDFIDRLLGKGIIDKEYASLHSELPEFGKEKNT